MTLAALNAAESAACGRALERCCGARAWVRAMLASRPYESRDVLHAAADRALAALARSDWLEAFAHHPRIGDVAALRTRFAPTAAWAGREQAGAARADDATLAALAAGNREYEARFGHIFIVCATGLSATEMLARLHARMGHDAATELQIAAEEQAKITHLRIDKLLDLPEESS